MKLVTVVLFLLVCLLLSDCQRQAPDSVSFNEDIRPIFNEKCLACHGGVKKLGGYSLLFKEEAYDTTESGKHGIVPGDLAESEVYQRITHQDPTLRMPLDHPALPKEAIQKIKRWIQAGAAWETHWAFQPIQQVESPDSKENSESVNNQIDRFVSTKLQEKGLRPSAPATPPTLVRRLYLDLVGLPPTLGQAEAFFNDRRADAYELLVDSLLASPHFGERWAVMWLDLARYGDSQGYQKDKLRRHIWRYRDWVIDAFNRDLPFDQFTIDQLAGDLIEHRTDNQLLATAFHRNTNTNDEGGTDDEEFRIVAVMDRLNTTMEIWQGLTMSCVQCHGHPYDPIRHEEFYKAFAFFNNTQDRDLSSEMPRIHLLSPGQQKEIERLHALRKQGEPRAKLVSENYLEEVKALLDTTPGAVPVLLEQPDSAHRTTHIFVRGNWLNHGDTVAPDVPKILNEFPADYPRNRLGFARWLVNKKNPLTARVIVNRFWAELFGRGLVETVEDFGTQGAAPSHPEMLDWLAWRFMHDHRWSVKALLKDIVTSATYRQSSITTPEMIELDPHNRWLARGPRFRLPAELIRDQMLVVTGLFNPKMYGPSVMPYQPEGVWNTIRHVARWETSQGGDQYRRGVYTFLRKTSPYPAFITFDGTSREFCVSRRIRTNTPLQAMVTLNDPVYMEGAQALALKMIRKHPDSVEDQIAYGYRLAMLKDPDPEKEATLRAFYQRALKEYRNDEDAVRALIEEPDFQTVEMAALVNVANIVLNLDEFINKG